MSELQSVWSEVERLVRLAQEGDRSAFGELFERFRGSVLAQARLRLRHEEEAAELVQEVFLHAMRKLNQLREPACFGAWLRRITVRVAINRATRRPPLPTADPSLLEDQRLCSQSPMDDLVKQEQRARVRSAVARLRPIDRDALVAFYLRGRSLVEIARDFEVPVGTVKRRLHVARHRLERALENGESGRIQADGSRPRRRERKLALAAC